MKKILLRGYYGFGNAGDDVLLSAILKKLEGDGREIEILSKYPLDTDLIKGNSNVLLNNKHLFQTVFNSDVVIYGGGSQLQDFGTYKNKVTLMRSLFLNWIMKIRKKKVIYLGVSIGPFSSKTGSILIKELMKSSDLTWVRDQKSYDYLQGFKNKKAKTILSPDLVLSLEADYLENIEKNAEAKVFGINLMPHFNKVELNEEVESSILENISIVIKEHPNMIFRFFQFQNSSQMNDEAMYEKLLSFLRTKGYGGNIEYIEYKNIDNLLIALKECDFFIGMRLHSAVLCDVLNIPHIMLSYHPKGEGYASLLNYKELMLVECKKERDFKYKIDNLIIKPKEFTILEKTKESKKEILKSFHEVNSLINY